MTLTRIVSGWGFALLFVISCLAVGCSKSENGSTAGQAGQETRQVTPDKPNEPPAPNPKVQMLTSHGKVVIELNAAKAPITVRNFLKYVDEGHYDGTIFHRVISTFMIQGGGFTPDMQQKSTHPPIRNEADNGLRNKRGTIAMARTGVIHSATCQFFINVVDNAMLDHTAKTRQGYGYCVFGEVIEGMDVVDKIRDVKVGSKGGHQNVPLETVLIEKMSRVADAEVAGP